MKVKFTTLRFKFFCCQGLIVLCLGYLFQYTRCPFTFQCPDTHSPLCGSNGVSYQNACYLQGAQCRSKLPIQVLNTGPCTITSIRGCMGSGQYLWGCANGSFLAIHGGPFPPVATMHTKPVISFQGGIGQAPSCRNPFQHTEPAASVLCELDVPTNSHGTWTVYFMYQATPMKIQLQMPETTVTDYGAVKGGKSDQLNIGFKPPEDVHEARKHYAIPSEAEHNEDLAIKSIPTHATCVHGFCYASYKQKVHWTKAEASCVDLGGHLVSVHSEEENALVGKVVGCCNGNYWIGLNKPKGSGQDGWAWTDGTKVDFFAWAQGEPNNWKSLNENFVSVWPKFQRWNDDTNKGEGVKFYICKWIQ